MGGLRFMSFNIHGCVGRGGREDPDATLDVIRQANADVVALQEVQEYDAADITFMHGLETLDYAHIIYGETFRKHAGPYGNVLMSRFPVRVEERLDISIGSVEPRGAIRVLLATPVGNIRVTATHLGLRGYERSRQIARLLAAPEMPHVKADLLMGDLNEWNPASRNLRRLTRAYPRFSAISTFPAHIPFLTLDRILVRGDLEPVRFQRVDSQAARRVSDHCALLAELG